MGEVGSAGRRRFGAREEGGLEMVWERCGARGDGGLERAEEEVWRWYAAGVERVKKEMAGRRGGSTQSLYITLLLEGSDSAALEGYFQSLSSAFGARARA